PMVGGGGAFVGGGGFSGGTPGVVPLKPTPGWLFRPANPEQMYEDLEIFRRLLSDKLQSQYRASRQVRTAMFLAMQNCTACHSTGMSGKLLDSTWQSSMRMTQMGGAAPLYFGFQSQGLQAAHQCP